MRKIAPLALAALVSACASPPTQQELATLCDPVVAAHMSQLYYQPGYPGHMWRGSSELQARLDCENRHRRDFSRKQTTTWAPVIAIVLGAGGDALAQSYPQFPPSVRLR